VHGYGGPAPLRTILHPALTEAHLEGKVFSPWNFFVSLDFVRKLSFYQPKRDLSRIHSYHDLNLLSLSVDSTTLLGPIPWSWCRPAPYICLPLRAAASSGITSLSVKQFWRVDEHSHWWLRGICVLCRVPVLKNETWSFGLKNFWRKRKVVKTFEDKKLFGWVKK